MFPFQQAAATVARRKALISQVRSAASATALRAGASSAGVAPSGVPPVTKSDYLSPRLHSDILELSHICAKNFALGAAATQLGVEKQFIVINSGLFGPCSPLTNLPYAHLTTPMNNAKTPLPVLLDRYPPPTDYPPEPTILLEAARAVTAANAAAAAAASAKDAAEAAATVAAPTYASLYPAFDPRVMTPTQRSDARFQYLLSDSLLNEFTVMMNPVVKAVHAETVPDMEGCLSVPLWSLTSQRPVAVDVEYLTFAFTPDTPVHDALLSEAVTIETMVRAAHPSAPAATAPATARPLAAAAAEVVATAEAIEKNVKKHRQPLAIAPKVSSYVAAAAASAAENGPPSLDLPVMLPTALDAPTPSPFAPAPALPHSPAFPPHSSSLGVDARRLSSPYRPPMDPSWAMPTLPTLIGNAGDAAAAHRLRQMGVNATSEMLTSSRLAADAAAAAGGNPDAGSDDEDLGFRPADIALRAQRSPLHLNLRAGTPELADQLYWSIVDPNEETQENKVTNAEAVSAAAKGIAPFGAGTSVHDQWTALVSLVPFEGSVPEPAADATAADGAAGGSAGAGAGAGRSSSTRSAAFASAAAATGGRMGGSAGKKAGGSGVKGKISAAMHKHEESLMKAPGATGKANELLVNRSRYERYLAQQQRQQEKMQAEAAAKAEAEAKGETVAGTEVADKAADSASATVAATGEDVSAPTESKPPVERGPLPALSPYAQGVRSAIATVTGDEAVLNDAAYVPSPPLPAGMQIVRRKVTFRDLAARLVIHEIEHLHGKLFVDLEDTAAAAAAAAEGEEAAKDAEAAVLGSMKYYGSSSDASEAKPKEAEEAMRLSYPITPTESYMVPSSVNALRGIRNEVLRALLDVGVRVGPGHGGDYTDDVGAAMPNVINRAVKKEDAIDRARAHAAATRVQ